MLNKDQIKAHLNFIIEGSILVMLFCLPFSKSIVEICVTTSIIAFAVKKIFIERTFEIKIRKSVLIGLLLFTIFNITSIMNSQYPALSVRALFSKVLEWVALFIIIADTIKTPAQFRRIIITMACSAALIITDALYQQYFSGFDFLHYPNRYPVFKFESRYLGKPTFPTASFPYPNDLAAWINVFMFVALILRIFDLREKLKHQYVATGFFVFLSFLLFRTASRGALFGAFLAILILVILNFKKLAKPFAIVLVILVLVISFVPYLRSELLDIKLSLDDRSGMWQTGFSIFKQHPIMGNGINTFFTHFKNFRTDEAQFIRGSYAHNCYLQMASDIGIFGLVSFLFFIMMVIVSNIKKSLKVVSSFEGALCLGLCLGVIAFLTHSFFDTNLYSLNLVALFWISMGTIEGIGSGLK